MKKVTVTVLFVLLLALSAWPASACNQTCLGLTGPCATLQRSTGTVCTDPDGSGPEHCWEMQCIPAGALHASEAWNFEDLVKGFACSTAEEKIPAKG